MQEGYWLPDLTHIKKDLNNMDKKWPGVYGPGEKDAIYEKYEGMVFVDFVPTSENLAGWLLEIAQNKMEGISNVRVKAVEYWETPKSHCRVENADV